MDYILGFRDFVLAHPEVGAPLTNQYTERKYQSDIDGASYVITTQWTTGGRLFYFQESNQVVFETRGGVAVAPPLPPPPAEVWIPSLNFYEGRSVPILAIVIHSMDGTLVNTDAYFSKTSSQVSTHKGIGLDGTVHRYVADENAAWGNGVLAAGKPWRNLAGVSAIVNPNQYTLSIETEDNGDSSTPVSPAQFSAVERVCRAWVAAHPTIKYLVAHNAITATACPGPRWLAGKLAELGAALHLQVVQ
jgi:hypothetical protein